MSLKFLLPVLFAWAVTAAAVTPTPTATPGTCASDGSASSVQFCHSQAKDGDTITVPPGAYSWGQDGVIITKAITLKGAGVGVTNITMSGHPVLHITKNATGIIRVQDISFSVTSGAGTLPDPILLDGAWPAGQPIIFNRVGVTLNGASLISCDLAGGVIFSHITFNGQWNDFFISVKDQLNTSSWTTASTMGSADVTGTKNIYIEDSTFTGGSNGIIDCDDNCRVVMRYNTPHNSGFYNSHGKDTSTYGARHFEIYNNIIDLPDKTCSGCGNTCLSNVGQYVWIRGGTGVVYNNSFEHLSTSCWGTKSEVRVNIRGAEDARPQGTCGQVVYPVPHQCGQSNNGSVDVTDPIWFWGNTGTGSVVNSAWAWNNPCVFNWNTFWQWGRDGQNTSLTLPVVLPSDGGSVTALGGSAKPGYTAFVYPHPMVGGSPVPTPTPSASATASPTPTSTATPTATATATPTAPPATLMDGLQVYYKLEDLTDCSGNGLTLTNHGTPSTPFVTGKVGNCVSITPASGQFLDYADDSHFQMGTTTNFTLACWVKFTSSALSGIAFYGSPANLTSPGWGIRQTFATAKAYIQDGTHDVELGTGASLNDGTWHFLLLTADRAGNAVFYVDGTTANDSASMSAVTGSLNQTGGTAWKLNSFWSDSFLGLVDEIGIWNRVLTGPEIVQLWNSGNGATCPFSSPTPTPTPTPTVTPTPTPASTPSVPTGLALVPTLTLTWNANPVGDGVTEYNVYRVRSGDDDLVATVTDPTSSIADFVPTRRTRFYVTAVNMNGESLPSSTVTVIKH